jgi:hypothetical protein
MECEEPEGYASDKIEAILGVNASLANAKSKAEGGNYGDESRFHCG